MKNILIAVFLSIAGLAHAQPGIVVQPSYKLGEKIVVQFEGDTIEDAEASLHWTLPPTVQSEAGSSDGRRLLLWAPSGLYDIKLQMSYTLDVMVPDKDKPGEFKVRKITFPPYEYSAQFKVGDAPSPPGPTPPGPTPPPGPAPPLTGLAALVPDAAKRALVAEFYADLAAASNQFVTTSHFRNAYRAAIAAAQTSGELPTGLAALDKPISDRIAAAIGLADTAMDAAKQAALAAELNRIAQELKQ